MDFGRIFSSFFPSIFLNISSGPFVALAKKKNSEFEPVIKPSIVEEVSLDDIEDDSSLGEFENVDLVHNNPFSLSLLFKIRLTELFALNFSDFCILLD